MRKIILFFCLFYVYNVFAQEPMFIHDNETAHIGPNTDICVYGDLEGDTITADIDGGFLIMKSDSMQKLKLNNIAKIQFDNPKGILLVDRSLIVNDTLDMVAGIINTQNNFLGLANNGKISNSISNTVHVNGFFRKIGNSAFTFPIGNGGFYAPISISAPNSVTDHFTGSYYHINPSTASYDRSSKDLNLSNISACEYWILDRTNGTSNVNVTLSWNTRSCGVSDLSKLRVARWNGTQWKDVDNIAYTGSSVEGTVTSSIISSFSPFTLASTSPVNALPVGLISFDAKCYDDYVKVSWVTSSEKDNSYFILQKSFDGKNWIDLSVINGNGTTSMTHNYEFLDYQKSVDYSYYRLADVSINKKVNFSYIISSHCSNVNLFEAKIYPNPVLDFLTLKVNKIDKGAFFEVKDELGRLLKNGKIEQAQTNIFVKDLVKGYYFIQIYSNESYSVSKFKKIE